jgi:hypothetical protein
MADQVSIANRALLAVGARAQVSSVTPSDGSEEGDAIAVLWAPTFEMLARTAPWNCLRKQATLSLLAAAQGTPENPDGTVMPLPPTPWLYMYAYPSDCLMFRFVSPSFPNGNGSNIPMMTNVNSAPTWLPTGGQVVFQISSNPDPITGAPVLVVLTNQDQAQAVYTANQSNPATWDSLFQQAMVNSLGAFLVPALSLSLPLMDRVVKGAESAIAHARTMDGNEGVTTMDHDPDWMQARLGGQGWGGGFGFNASFGWGEMVWPGFYNGGSYG